ncbi:MAG TPA: hypothetical protein VFS67_11140 [Polyangiaceae bacterium]|nr:hypothetical protein [Polyangiaceae bacterium]
MSNHYGLPTRGASVEMAMRDMWSPGEIPAAEPLWRYFKTERFLESLARGELYFPAARQFEDKFEGAVAVERHDSPLEQRDHELCDVDSAFEELRRLTKVSCWHRADFESDAMWKIYAEERKGLAIRTTAERLKAGLRPFRLAPNYGEEIPYWGLVRYVDLFADRLRVGAEARFFYKHRAFEWERELRVIFSVRMAEEFAVPVPELGINVAFDAPTLIESIYLGPHLHAVDRHRILDACEAAGVGRSVVTSSLLGRPRYH